MPSGRRRLHGTGRQPRKNEREHYTNAQKLDAINHFIALKCIDASVNATFLNVREDKRDSKRKLIRRWAKERAKIEAACLNVAGRAKMKNRASGVATTLPADVEGSLVR
jgi:hypothetical protein